MLMRNKRQLLEAIAAAVASFFIVRYLSDLDLPFWLMSVTAIGSMLCLGVIYLAIRRLVAQRPAPEAARTFDMPRIRLDLACAFIAMAALNGTYFSVIISDPGLFLMALVGNIILFGGLAWLARDKQHCDRPGEP
jgi:hypothetical protein